MERLTKKVIKFLKDLKERIRYSTFMISILYWNKPYYFSIVGEVIFNKKYYNDHIAGRLEIYDIFSNSPYAEYEIRYFTDKIKEFSEFSNKYDFKQISKRKLNKLTKEVNEKYNIFYSDNLVED